MLGCELEFVSSNEDTTLDRRVYNRLVAVPLRDEWRQTARKDSSAEEELCV
jgi:hypothetical protein